MLAWLTAHAAEHATTAQQAVEHGAEHAAPEGSEFIMHHILAQPVIHLPTVLGIDLTITNHVIMMWIVSVVLILLFGLAFRRKRTVPKGLANALESVVAYLREDLILPNLGPEGRAYAPYLLTAFFFILLSNLFGLVPYGATATGNIAVTGTLAMLTFSVGFYAGMRKHGALGYLKHFVPPGIPLFVVIILFPVEILSLFTKHIALAVRLFANMIAGHITILALMMIIFIFKSWLVAGLPLLIIVFSALLETLIALIQAYVFTILSAVFIGQAVADEH
ncbi:F0F1 ATP synthase subunit A [candidate division KSB1 bacterium]|jgi:F-type H+-transporting ATPase subunit a|nr:F0F1 ATP synthase subunit A [candidate division KSB1 bacterium]